jgi:hypothetical protein
VIPPDPDGYRFTEHTNPGGKEVAAAEEGRGAGEVEGDVRLTTTEKEIQ